MGDMRSGTKHIDLVVVILIFVGNAVLLLGNMAILWFRDYRPVKTKSVALTVLSSLGGLIWVSATIVVNTHFGKSKGTWLTQCTLWTFWLQFCFGFALWLNCLIARLFTLYQIFIQRRDPCKYAVTPVLLLQLPVFIFCTFASIMKGSRFQLDVPSEKKGDCKVDKYWAYPPLSMVLLYFLLFLGLAFSLRRVMAQYNEFRLIRNGGIMSLFLFLLVLVTFQTKAYYQPTGRCFLSLSVAIAVFYYFWARNGEVIFNACFHKAKYERRFLDELNRLPSEQSRERFPDSFKAIEDRLKQLREDNGRYHIQIKKLENQLELLEERHNETQEQVSS